MRRTGRGLSTASAPETASVLTKAFRLGVAGGHQTHCSAAASQPRQALAGGAGLGACTWSGGWRVEGGLVSTLPLWGWLAAGGGRGTTGEGGLLVGAAKVSAGAGEMLVWT